MNLEVLAYDGVSASEAPFEAVERKGRGHPDTICDLIAEQASSDLRQFYVKQCGRVLHYNVDKALLVGGKAAPAFGGGTIIEPAKLYLGDRAISCLNGHDFNLIGLIDESIAGWLEDNLRFLRLNETLLWKNEIHEGATALNAVEERCVSNDTSVGVGFWPLSTMEQMTLAIEEHMNSREFKQRFPASGEDIKVMAVRHGKAIEVIMACALVGRYIANVDQYTATKTDILDDVAEYLRSTFPQEHHVTLALNALDDPVRGTDGLYLTVSGLSCEGGDSGQVGRGNRVNGLISFLRPQTMEAWAGKNPNTHVGKIYSFAAQDLARRLNEEIPEIKEATVVLVGKIGSPINQPADVFADLKIWGHCRSAVEHHAAELLKTAMSDGAVFVPETLFQEPILPFSELTKGLPHVAPA